MNRASCIVAVVLLVTLAAALPGVQAFALSAAPPEPPAGCHGHTPVPAPAHTNYACCVGGHHQAVAGTSFSLRAPVTLSDLETGEDLSRAFLLGVFPAPLALPSTSPPGAAPLRI